MKQIFWTLWALLSVFRGWVHIFKNRAVSAAILISLSALCALIVVAPYTANNLAFVAILEQLINFLSYVIYRRMHLRSRFARRRPANYVRVFVAGLFSFGIVYLQTGLLQASPSRYVWALLCIFLPMVPYYLIMAAECNKPYLTIGLLMQFRQVWSSAVLITLPTSALNLIFAYSLSDPTNGRMVVADAMATAIYCLLLPSFYINYYSLRRQMKWLSSWGDVKTAEVKIRETDLDR